MGEMVKVDTAALKQHAESFKKTAKSLQSDFNELQKVVERTRYYWVGQAGDRYRQRFAAKKDTTDAILTRLVKYPQDLLTMANLYEQTETVQTRKTAALKTNYI